MTSCGKRNSSGSEAELEGNPVINKEELTIDETSIIKALVNKGVFNQKDLLQRLIDNKLVSTKALKRLDQFINVQCIQASGLCYITQKD